jgi:hypothetical protein
LKVKARAGAGAETNSFGSTTLLLIFIIIVPTKRPANELITPVPRKLE